MLTISWQSNRHYVISELTFCERLRYWLILHMSCSSPEQISHIHAVWQEHWNQAVWKDKIVESYWSQRWEMSWHAQKSLNYSSILIMLLWNCCDKLDHTSLLKSINFFVCWVKTIQSWDSVSQHFTRAVSIIALLSQQNQSQELDNEQSKYEDKHNHLIHSSIHDSASCSQLVALLQLWRKWQNHSV